MRKLLNNLSASILLLCSFSVFSLQGQDMVTAPIAKKINVTFEEHGQTRSDPYHWLNQRDTPDVLAYLKAENDYATQKMQATEPLQQKLFAEIKNRIKEDDSSVPIKKDDYYYYSRVEKNKTYPIYCRKKNSLSNPEEIMLDVNVLAKGHDYFEVGDFSVSTNQNLLAYAEDIQGRRIYTIRFKDLTTGELLKDTITNSTDNFHWANDNRTLFYVKQDPVSLRAFQLYQHKLNDSSPDKLVFEEKDDTFSIDILKTKSKQYLMIGSFKKDTSEYQIVDANQPDKAFQVFSPRLDGREYYVEHHANKFIIRTNDNAKNFKLMICPLNKTTFQNWQPWIAHDEKVYLEDLDVFDDFLAIEERQDGLIRIKILPFSKESPYYIDFAEPDYLAYIGENPEISSKQVRYGFSSLKTPRSVFDFDTTNKTKILKKQSEILGGFDSKNYHSQRIFAKAQDGVSIPVSVVYRKELFKAQQNPILIEGYGSYGVTLDAAFNPLIISLLDRGFVYAIAHVRGGGELGREWYYQGKLLNKKNTFTDFIAVAEHLDKIGMAAPQKKYATGGSAGGLLMGAVVNMRPDLFNGIVADVPFVDLINTMLDPNIPLTTGEYAEWGNPKDKTYYDYMLSYSPYDNVQTKAYPNILITTGYHDSQVQYWEPAKWTARLRALKTNNNLLILRTQMEAGHSGASGRYEGYKEKALEYAFLLNLESQLK